LDKEKICRAICVNILAFIVGGIAAWFFSYGIEINYLTVLPVEALQQMLAI